MFDKDFKTSLLIRLIVGRGWGQGPTHSQSYHSFLSSLPGINVLYPFDPNSAYHTIKYGMTSKIPTLMIEHRWLHNSISKVNFNDNSFILGKCKILQKGSDLTLVASSNMVIESLKVLEIIKKNHINLNVELIDVRTYKPLDINTILKSVKKTGRLIVVDPGFDNCSFGSEIISQISTKAFKYMKTPPIKIASHDIPEPTSFFYTKKFNINYRTILNKISEVFKHKKLEKINLKKEKYHDIPGDWFKGPF